MKDSRNFLPLEELINTYKVRVMPLKYFGLISALRHHYNANFPKEPSDTHKPSASLRYLLKATKETGWFKETSLFQKLRSGEKSNEMEKPH